MIELSKWSIVTPFYEYLSCRRVNRKVFESWHTHTKFVELQTPVMIANKTFGYNFLSYFCGTYFSIVKSSGWTDDKKVKIILFDYFLTLWVRIFITLNESWYEISLTIEP